MTSISPTPAEAASACARYIAQALHDALSARPRATLAVSGGTAVTLLFPALLAESIAWDRVELFWVDERGVPPDHEQSNFRLANELLVVPSGIPSRNVHRIRAELDPADAAARYVDEIRSVFQLPAGAIPRFDVIHHGMGPDSHTASLFPGETLIEDRAGIAAGVYVPVMGQWRITLLPAPLLLAGHSVFFVTGAGKAEALRAVVQGPYQPLQHPSQVVARNSHNVSWFLDGPAAALLA